MKKSQEKKTLQLCPFKFRSTLNYIIESIWSCRWVWKWQRWSLQTNSVNISQTMSSPLLLITPFNMIKKSATGKPILFLSKQTSHFIALFKLKDPGCFPRYHILFCLPTTALKLPIVHFIHSAIAKEWGLGHKKLHRKLTPRVKMDSTVWI